MIVPERNGSFAATPGETDHKNAVGVVVGPVRHGGRISPVRFNKILCKLIQIPMFPGHENQEVFIIWARQYLLEKWKIKPSDLRIHWHCQRDRGRLDGRQGSNIGVGGMHL